MQVVPIPCRSGYLTRVSLNATVGSLKSGQQPGTGIPHGCVGVHLFDRLDCDTAGFLPAFISAHAVGHDGQPALQRKIVIVSRLPIGIAVFVVFSLAANIAETRQLNSGPNFHSIPSQKVELHSELGIIPDKGALEDEG